MGCGREELPLQFVLVPVEVHGSTRCVSLPGWEMLGATFALCLALSRAIYELA